MAPPNFEEFKTVISKSSDININLAGCLLCLHSQDVNLVDNTIFVLINVVILHQTKIICQAVFEIFRRLIIVLKYLILMGYQVIDSTMMFAEIATTCTLTYFIVLLLVRVRFGYEW